MGHRGMHEWPARNSDLTDLTSFPNVLIVLRILLMMCSSIATRERSFSKLKFIKNYSRSTMTQSSISNLAILSIKHELANSINFDNIINEVDERSSSLILRKLFLSPRRGSNPQPFDDWLDALTIELLRLRW